MHGNRPPMILFGHTRALVGRTIKKMLGVDAVDEVIPISRQDAEAEFGRNYELMARQNMIRNETVSVLSGDNPFLREKMDIKKADMGDVVDDFKKSDAPQFQGKSMAKRRQMAVAAKLNSEGAMKRIATQDAEKERLGPRKVKGSGMDTFKKKYPDHLTLKKARAAFAPTKGGADVKKKDIKLSEATDPKMIKTLKAMIKDGDEQSVRLLIQGLPKNMKKDVMKKLGLKEDIDVRAVARNEIVERLNKAKITEAEKATKDMNGDGKIDAKDLKIQNLEKDLKIRNLEADIEAADTPETPAPMIPQKMRVMDKGDSWDCVDEKGDCSKSFPYDNKKTTSKSARHDANRYAEKAYDQAIKGAMKEEKTIIEDEQGRYKMTYTKHHTKDNKLHLDVHHTSVDFKGERPNNTPRVKKLVSDSPQHKEMKAKGFSISKYGEHDDHSSHENIHGNKPTITKESVNEKTLEELSKKTMGSYINKAVKSKGNAYTRDGVGAGKAMASDTYQDKINVSHAANKSGDNMHVSMAANDDGSTPGYDKPARNRKIRNRSGGIDRAVDKMSAESNQVDELSKKTLGNYVKKASDDHGYKSQSRGLNHTDPEGHDEDPTTEPTSNRPTDVFSKRRKAATGSAHTVASKQAALKKDISNREKGIATAVKKMSEKTADEQEADGGGHIVMQLRKSVSMRGQKDVKFNDGSTHKVSAAHADKFLSKHASLKTSHEKRALQNQAAKSHNHLQKSISEEGLSERTPVRATVQDRKLKNLRVPNPNYKNKEYVRPKKKDNERSMDVYREEEEVVSENYTSAEFYADYLSIVVKK
jgi:hypothetical protein